ncbi:MAG: hypothetical protein NT154_02570 [Verrucomicrobia bacterium]|nr:hypothetical protein [Verrucomicrobiota bacterium]
MDRPMIKANLSTHDLYIAGLSTAPTKYGVFAAHSSNGGTNWDVCSLFDTDAQFADIAVTPASVAYVTWIAYTNSGSGYANQIRYAWLAPGSTNWSNPRDLGITLNSQTDLGFRYALRFNGDDSKDNFEMLPFPRTAFANGRLYVAYSDLPNPGSTTDQGDIFLAEAATNSNCSLATPLVVRLNDKNNDRTLTDQWDPAIAVRPGGPRPLRASRSAQPRSRRCSTARTRPTTCNSTRCTHPQRFCASTFTPEWWVCPIPIARVTLRRMRTTIRGSKTTTPGLMPTLAIFTTLGVIGRGHGRVRTSSPDSPTRVRTRT